MHRMLETLGDRVVLVAAGDTGGASATDTGTDVFEVNRVRRGRNVFRKLGLPNFAYRISELRGEIRQRGITHILCHYGVFALDFESIFQTSAVKGFVHFHGYDAMFDLRSAEPPHKRIHSEDYPARLKRLSSKSTFIANSDFLASELIRHGISPHAVQKKYLGVVPANEPKIHIEKPAIKIVAVGRLIDCKGPTLTIRAFDLACQQGMVGELIIIGNGPEIDACLQQKKTSDYAAHIHILGSLPGAEVSKHLESADIFSQHNITGPVTHQIEAFGVSILEAMAIGLPTVCTRSGGVPEIVVDGETGFLGTPASVEEQAASLLRLAKDAGLRNRLGLAGYERVKSHFSLKAEGERLLEILSNEEPEPSNISVG